MEMRNLFIKYKDYLPIALDERQIDKFVKFYHFLIEKNKVMNLTAIVETEDVMLKHFIDSLAIVNNYGKLFHTAENIIDVGTGAGFPGIPLAIAFPDLKFTLLDSLKKRISFIEESCRLCDIKNVEAIHGRAEEYGKNAAYREQYDICVSRAVANLSVLLEYCSPFIKIGGKFISYKSGDVQPEIDNLTNPLEKLNVQIEDIIYFKLPKLEAGRSFVVFNKTGRTEKKYPRVSAKIAKYPL